ncbi:MAG: transcriptional regulator HilA [Pseudomonadota bacterium]|jgi:TolB-like protein
MTLRWSCAGFEIRADERALIVAGAAASVGARAFDLLVYLARHRDRVVGKDELLRAAWPGLVVEDNNLSVQIAALRKLLGAGAIATVTGVGYRFTAPVDEGPAPQSPAGLITSADPSERHTLAAGGMPALAVMPFANLSGDANQDYFVEGVVDDIRRALTRVRRFAVIARSTTNACLGRAHDAASIGRELGVRYLVEGSFRQIGDHLRIGAQLVETNSGRLIWSEHYDGIREDVFDLQDRIAQRVAASIEPTLYAAELDRLRLRPTDSLAAYELCLRALASATRSASRDDVMRALGQVRRALEIDPGYAQAKALAAWAYAMAWANRWMDRHEAAAGLPLAQGALDDHHDDPYTLTFAGHAVAVLGRQFDQAHQALSQALALTPDSITVLAIAGWISVYRCELDLAQARLERAVALDEPAARARLVNAALAYAHLIGGRPQAALSLACEGVLAHPQFIPGRLALLHAWVRTGQLGEARALAAELGPLMPRLSVTRYVATQLFIDEDFRRRCGEDLRLLGVPE